LYPRTPRPLSTRLLYSPWPSLSVFRHQKRCEVEGRFTTTWLVNPPDPSRIPNDLESPFRSIDAEGKAPYPGSTSFFSFRSVSPPVPKISLGDGSACPFIPYSFPFRLVAALHDLVTWAGRLSPSLSATSLLLSCLQPSQNPIIPARPGKKLNLAPAPGFCPAASFDCPLFFIFLPSPSRLFSQCPDGMSPPLHSS